MVPADPVIPSLARFRQFIMGGGYPMLRHLQNLMFGYYIPQSYFGYFGILYDNHFHGIPQISPKFYLKNSPKIFLISPKCPQFPHPHAAQPTILIF